LTYAAYIRVAEAILERHGQIDTAGSASTWRHRMVYKDLRVSIVARTAPKELVLKAGSNLVIHLYGGNLLHFDENKAIFSHLVTLLPGDGVLLDVIAAVL
jgi:hypothetical protein